MTGTALSSFLVALLASGASSFSTAPRRPTLSKPSFLPHVADPRLSSRLASLAGDDGIDEGEAHAQSRRSILRQGLAAASMATMAALPVGDGGVARAALGTLPEFADTNAIFQSLTVDVTDKSQFDETVAFFTGAFDGMKVLRERGGGAKEAVSACPEHIWCIAFFISAT